MRQWVLLLFVLMLPPWSSVSNASEVPYAQAAQTMIAESRAQGCARPDSLLAEVLCRQTLRFGVRINYRLFSEATGKEFKGFEIDLANLIAAQLGVRAEFLGVTASSRIEKLLNRKVDVVLATMAHTTAREEIIHFIRPHYYSSPTTIVGRKDSNIRSWEDLIGKPVCVPSGNFSNIVFSEHRVRLLIYDRPDRMIDALRLGACGVIAHDRSLLQSSVFGSTAPKDLSSHFEEKLSFDEAPWGIGIRKNNKDDLGTLLSLVMADLHQSGDLQKLAREHHLDTDFLSSQKALLSQPTCMVNHRIAEKCLGAAAELSDIPTAIAPSVNLFEEWLNKHTGLHLKFPMLIGQNAARLFVNGITTSLLLVVGSIMATIGFAFLFFNLLRSRFIVIRVVTNITVHFFQNSPIILLLVLGYLVITYLTSYGTFLAVFVSIIVIGLNNGANGGSAMNETFMVSMSYSKTLAVAKDASIQLRAAVINATKASPVAGFIGAPELMDVLTDITSFSGERVTTYLILSFFYLILVQTVVIVSGRLTDRYKRNG